MVAVIVLWVTVIALTASDHRNGVHSRGFAEHRFKFAIFIFHEE